MQQDIKEVVIDRLTTLAIGDTVDFIIPRTHIDRIRTAAQKLGRFSFISQPNDGWAITRRHPKELSQRAQVRLALAKNPLSVCFGIPLNNVRQYVKAWNDEYGVCYEARDTPDGVLVTRNIAAEVCAPLIAVLNNPKSSVETIKALLEEVSKYCDGVCNSRRIWNE